MNRRVLAVLVVLLTAPLARAEMPACPVARAAALAVELDLPAPDWAPASAGVFLRLAGDDGTTATVWLARGADGRQLISSAFVRPESNTAWPPLLRRLVAGLEPALVESTCLGAAPTTQQTTAIVDQLSASDVGSRTKQDLVPRSIAWALAAYVALVLVGFTRGARARPRRALVILAVTLAGLALRLLIAPRLTMVAAQADLGPVDVALSWLSGPWAWSAGDYPPFVATLLAVLFELLGPSLELAFLANAVLGALLGAAAYVLAEGLDATRRAALPAGVIAATLPLSVWFSNGISLVTPAAVFAAASLAHLLAWTTTRRTSDLAAAALASVLFVQCRPEGFVQAAVLGVALATVFARAGGLTVARPRLTGFLALAGAILLVAPFVATVVPYYVDTLSNEPRQSLPMVVALAAALALFALIGPRLRELAARIAPGARTAVVLGLAAAVAVALVLRTLNDSMRVHDPSRPLVPVQWWLGTLRSVAGTDKVRSSAFLLEQPWFPGTLVVAAVLAWLPSRRAPRSTVASLGLVSCLAVVAVIVTVALSFSVSGESVAQGLRYQVPALGFAAALAGVGFARVAEHLERLPVRPGVVQAALLAVAALPVVTHLDVTTNVWHDSQREFLFVRDAVTRLPETSVVLVTDQEYRSEGCGPTPPRIDAIFRSHTFVRALARLAHRTVEVRGVTEWLASPHVEKQPVFFLRELGCYRTLDASGVEPLCEAVRSVAARAPLARVEFPHRLYDAMSEYAIRAGQPSVFDLDLVPLSSEELKELRARLATRRF